MNVVWNMRVMLFWEKSQESVQRVISMKIIMSQVCSITIAPKLSSGLEYAIQYSEETTRTHGCVKYWWKSYENNCKD